MIRRDIPTNRASVEESAVEMVWRERRISCRTWVRRVGGRPPVESKGKNFAIPVGRSEAEMDLP